MYNALLILLLGIAAFLFLVGSKKQQKAKMLSGVILAALTLFFFWFMDFWGEALWYANLGYGNRFWMYINSNAALAVAGALVGFLAIYLLTLPIPKEPTIFFTTNLISQLQLDLYE